MIDFKREHFRQWGRLFAAEDVMVGRSHVYCSAKRLRYLLLRLDTMARSIPGRSRICSSALEQTR